MSGTHGTILIDGADVERNPYESGKVIGIRSQVICKDFGPQQMFAPYGFPGPSNHLIDKGAKYRSADAPDVHGGAMEVFICVSGHLAVYTQEVDGVRTFLLSTSGYLFIPAGTPHWFEALEETRLITFLAEHKEYSGGVPWRSDAVI
jgi:mannose-6-phosphate isomerase-like protein (cupin superfamily)